MISVVRKMTKKALLWVCLVALVLGVTAAPRKRRVPDEDISAKEEEKVVICAEDTNCGWTVYTPFTKEEEYFMKNNYCECPTGKGCLYYDDDISIGAFVHRCQTPVSTTKPLQTNS